MTCTSRYIGVVANVHAQPARVDVPVAPQKKSTKHWLGQDIKNTIEDSFGVGCNQVAALGQTPGDWVEEPQEDSPDATDQIYLADIRSDRISMFAGRPGDCPSNPEESEAPEHEVSPLSDGQLLPYSNPRSDVPTL